MGKSDGQCKLCKAAEEDLPHLLYYCTKISPVWTTFNRIINQIIKKNIVLNFESVIFGNCINDNIGNAAYIVNLFILEVKWQIWKNRNSVKYGGKECLNVNSICENVLDACKKTLMLYNNTHCKRRIISKLKIVIDNNARINI